MCCSTFATSKESLNCFRGWLKMLDAIDTSKLNNRQKPTLQPMGFSDILDGTFSLYRNHFKLFLSIAAVYHIVKFGNELFSTFLFSPLPQFIGSVLNLLDYFVSCFVLAGLTYASMQTYLGRQVTLRAALQRVLHRFLPCFYGWLFVFLVIVLLTVLIGMFFRFSIGFGFVLALTLNLLAIYFLIRWYFYGMFILFEGSTVGTALRRSTELVEGTWGRVFGIASAIYSISLMIALILLTACVFLLVLTGIIDEAPFLEMISRVLSPRVGEVGWLSYVIQRFMVRSVAVFTTLPIWAIGPTLLYFDLRIRKEGFDIEMRVHNS